MKLPDLLREAESAGLLTPAQAGRATSFLQQQAQDDRRMPWYLQALIAIGAWFAAAFFLGFLFALLADTLLKSSISRLVFGVLMIGGVTALRQMVKSVFLHQISLAGSVAGHVLLFSAADGLTHELFAIMVTAVLLAAILYPFYDDPLHRFLSCGTALGLSTVWLYLKLAHPFTFKSAVDALLQPAQWLYHGSVLAHGLALWFALARPGAGRVWRPLGYAAAVSLLLLLLMRLLPWDAAIFTMHYPVAAIVGTALIGLCFWARGELRRDPVMLAVLAGVVLLSVVANPAIVAALALLVLGYGLQDRALLTLGGLYLPFVLTLYYYNLNLDLMRKSLLLMGSGAVLLALYAFISRVHLPVPERSSA